MILSQMERRYSLENPNVPIAEGFSLLNLFGGKSSVTGREVTAESALSIAAVSAAVRMIAGTLGALPIKLYRRQSDGGKEEERGHWGWDFVAQGPSPYLKSCNWKEASQGHLLLRGNAFLQLIRENSRSEAPVGVLRHPDKVEAHLPDRGEPFYTVLDKDGKRQPVMWDEMLHVAGPGGNGVTGWSVLTQARESFALGLSSDEYAARFYANSARPSGILSAPEALTPEVRDRIAKSWQAAQGGLHNAHKVAVLEGGLTWQQMSLSAEDAQFLQSRAFSVREVARWFLLPPHLIGDLEDATFSNISEQQIQYMTDTMEPWLTRWEQALNMRLLTPEERRAGLFFEFVRDARMQGDPEKRGAFYTAQVNVGAMTPNEVRIKENRNPVSGGERAFIRLDMVPLDQAGQMSIDERAQLLLAEQGVAMPEGETRDLTEKREIRSYHARYQLRASFRPLFADASDRLVRGEIRDVRRKLGIVGTSDYTDWLEEYYFQTFPEFFARTMGPLFDTYARDISQRAAEEIGLDAPTADVGEFSAIYTETAAARHARSSRLSLTNAEERAEAEARLQYWDEGTADTNPRHVQIAQREIVQLSEAVSRSVWAAGGLMTIRWVIVGDTCPFCKRLSGKTVGISDAFVQAGESVIGEGTETPFIPKRARQHPPLHAGCDCILVPAI